jgi:hypothetical protein
MKLMNSALLTLVVFLIGCVTHASEKRAPTHAGPGQSPSAEKPVFREAKHLIAAPIAQTLSPDSSVLSVLFQGLEANADSVGLGIATFVDALALPIEGSGERSINIDVRGTIARTGGECELTLETQETRVVYISLAEGAFAERMSLTVKLPTILRLAIHGLCWAPDAPEATAGYLSVDSVDLAFGGPL